MNLPTGMTLDNTATLVAGEERLTIANATFLRKNIMRAVKCTSACSPSRRGRAVQASDNRRKVRPSRYQALLNIQP